MPVLPFGPPSPDLLSATAAGVPQSARGGAEYGAVQAGALAAVGQAAQGLGGQLVSYAEKKQSIKDNYDVATSVAGNSFQKTNNDTIMNTSDPTGGQLPGEMSANFDVYAKKVMDDLTKSGASPAALKARSLKLAEEKKQVLDNTAVTSTKMAEAAGNRAIDTGDTTLLNDIAIHGVVAQKDFEIAVKKQEDAIMAQPGPDQNAKLQAVKDMRNKAATVRFNTLLFPQGGGLTKEALAGIQKDLNDPYWAKQLEPTPLSQLQAAISTSAAAFGELTAEQQADPMINRVAGDPSKYEAELANLLGVDTKNIPGTKIPAIKRDNISAMTRVRFEALGEQAVTGGDQLMETGKAKTKAEAEAQIDGLIKDLNTNPVWQERLTSDQYTAAKNSLQTRKNALDADWNRIQNATIAENHRLEDKLQADVAASSTSFLSRMEKGGMLPDGEFSAYQDKITKLGRENLTAVQLNEVNKVEAWQRLFARLPEHYTQKDVEALKVEAATGGTGTGVMHSPTPPGGSYGGFTAHPNRNMLKLKLADSTADMRDVSAGLQDSVAAGATHLPPGYTVEATEGYSATGHVAHSQHKIPGKGAIDLWIVDPNGHRIPREGADTTGMYGRLAHFTRLEMQKRHPELVADFRWGGTFETRSGSGRADLMHFDLGGRGRGGGGVVRAGDSGDRGGLAAWKVASAANETADRPNPYQVKSDKHAPDGTYDWGKYQVNEKNIGPWTEQYVGKRMSIQEFLASPDAQEKVYEGEFGRLVQKYGIRGAAAAWNGGEGGMNSPAAQAYANRFMSHLGAGAGSGGPVDTSGGAPGPTRADLILAPKTDTQVYTQQALDIAEKNLSDGLKNNTIEFGAQQLGLSVVALDVNSKESFNKRAELYGNIDKANGGLSSDQQHPLEAADVGMLGGELNSNDSQRMNKAWGLIATWPAKMQEAAWKQLEEVTPFGAAAGRTWASGRPEIANLAVRGRKVQDSLKADGVTPTWMAKSEEWYASLGPMLAGLVTPTKGAGVKQVIDAVHMARHPSDTFDPATYQKDAEDVLGVKFDTVHGASVAIIPGTTGKQWEDALPALDLTAVSFTQTPALAVDPVKLITDPEHSLLPVNSVAVDNAVPIRMAEGLYAFMDTDGNFFQTITHEKTPQYPNGKPQVYLAQLTKQIIENAAVQAHKEAVTPDQTRVLKTYETGMGAPAGPDANLGVTPPPAGPPAPPAPTSVPSLTTGVPGEPPGVPSPNVQQPSAAPAGPRVITPTEEKGIQTNADNYIETLSRNASLSKDYLKAARDHYVETQRQYYQGLPSK